MQSAVLSVTYIKAGETYNVIPPTAELRGTVRYFEPDVKQKVYERLEHIVDSISRAFNCQSNLELTDLTPAVDNDVEVTQRLATLANKVIPTIEINSTYRTMVSEDMALMMEKVPGCYFLVGAANPARGLNYGHHHPRFDFDEAALVNAAALMASATVELLEN